MLACSIVCWCASLWVSICECSMQQWYEEHTALLLRQDSEHKLLSGYFNLDKILATRNPSSANDTTTLFGSFFQRNFGDCMLQSKGQSRMEMSNLWDLLPLELVKWQGTRPLCLPAHPPFCTSLPTLSTASRPECGSVLVTAARREEKCWLHLFLWPKHRLPSS